MFDSNSRLYPSHSLLPRLSLSASVIVCILASVQSAKLSAIASASAGFFGGPVFQLPVVGDHAVLELAGQHFREIRDRADRIADHLHADDDMPKELPVICVVVGREGGELPDLPDVVAHGGCIQQVPVEDGVRPHHIFAEFHHA